ncbi:Outer membrane lipoprotein [Mucilaginibacter mallensis]|uniref:Outer membrane lipoprotein n=1 Tax=Mucilaginibacter mallensis TaxID=652787 RepID=A0A1H2AYT6_MUCMA|nr:tetratricopeptide repeat protein [Mucilaginibacter mallensis]SDT50706.1 Outer membrane lipoprotein [Mucilaginibacter mallensis]
MKWFNIIIFLVFIGSYSKVFAQTDDMQLAAQYAANGEQQKALEIYQKLYKQSNENYFSPYIKCLLSLKKFNEAESISQKMIRKHPDNSEYVITLGSIYTQNGNGDKASQLYDGLIKNLPADQMAFTNVANQFYQNSNIDYSIKTLEQGRKVLKNDNLFSFELLTLYRYKGDKVALSEEYLNFLPANPAYVAQAENILSGIYEGEADYNMLKTALFKRIQKNPDQPIYVDLLIWQYLQQKDFDQALNQALALNRRNNDSGNNIYELCQTLVNNEAYDEAIRGYQFLIDKGKDGQFYVAAKVELINAKSLKITSGKYTHDDLAGLEKDYQDLLTEFGKGTNTAFAMHKLATLQAFKLHKWADAQKLLEEVISIPGVRPDLLATCKLDLGDIYLINGNQWDATLLYSQVEKDFPNTDVGQDAKFRNAKLGYYTGDFDWSKRQLNVLKAATSQLIANDALNLSLLITDNLAADSSGAALKVYARADLLIFAEEPEKAVKTLDSIDTKFPNNALTDDILMAKARILIQQKKYTDAIPLLKKIVETHPTNLWADDAVFMLGDIYENQLADKAQAKMYYQKIITDYPGSLWINEARKRFRTIRGDQPAS